MADDQTEFRNMCKIEIEMDKKGIFFLDANDGVKLAVGDFSFGELEWHGPKKKTNCIYRPRLVSNFFAK